jgi:uncharacterized membrane protein (DUF2068 family)
MTKDERAASALIAIGVFKLLKAALLFTIAFGIHHFLHRDLQEIVVHWARAVRVDPENRFVHTVISKVSGVSPRQLQAISLGTFLYGTLFATEGIGLLLRKRWAEYLTVISTALLLPVEVYELFHRFRWAKLIVLVLNVAIVAYLIWQLRRSGSHKRRRAESQG